MYRRNKQGKSSRGAAASAAGRGRAGGGARWRGLAAAPNCRRRLARGVVGGPLDWETWGGLLGLVASLCWAGLDRWAACKPIESSGPNLPC